MIEVKLDYPEIMQAAQIGMMRQIECIKWKSVHKNNLPRGDSWQMHIEGALAEVALAKHLNVFHSKGQRAALDVGLYEVRSTPSHTNRLIVQKDDPDDHFCWLVTGSDGSYRIHGGMRYGEAKHQKYWTDPVGGRPAYFVPQCDLYFPS